MGVHSLVLELEDADLMTQGGVVQNEVTSLIVIQFNLLYGLIF